MSPKVMWFVLICLAGLYLITPDYHFPPWIFKTLLNFCTEKEASFTLVVTRCFYDVFVLSHNIEHEEREELVALACSGLALKYCGHNDPDMIQSIALIGPIKHQKTLMDAYPKLEHLMLKVTHYNLGAVVQPFDLDNPHHEALVILGCILLKPKDFTLLLQKKYTILPWSFWLNVVVLIYQKAIQTAATKVKDWVVGALGSVGIVGV